MKIARLLLLCWLCAGAVANATEVVAEGLLPGMAVLRVDGTRVTLRPGQEHGAVRVIDVAGDHAILEIDGRRQRVGLSERVAGSYQSPEERTLTIRRNANMQYITSAEINGRRMQVLVDTGANLVAMNRGHARALGIGDDEGTPSLVQTASDLRTARQVQLRSVSVGGIEAQAIGATILEGDQPAVILLGMSYLQHVRLEENDGLLTLRARW